MALVLVSGDLATIARVEGEALRQHVPLWTTTNPEQAAAYCAEQAVALVIVDLATPSFDVAALVPKLTSGAARGPAVVAFGPHVHDALLAAAASAGCDEVFSRGQFFARLDEIVSRHVGGRD